MYQGNSFSPYTTPSDVYSDQNGPSSIPQRAAPLENSYPAIHNESYATSSSSPFFDTAVSPPFNTYSFTPNSMPSSSAFLPFSQGVPQLHDPQCMAQSSYMGSQQYLMSAGIPSIPVYDNSADWPTEPPPLNRRACIPLPLPTTPDKEQQSADRAEGEENTDTQAQLTDAADWYPWMQVPSNSSTSQSDLPSENYVDRDLPMVSLDGSLEYSLPVYEARTTTALDLIPDTYPEIPSVYSLADGGGYDGYDWQSGMSSESVPTMNHCPCCIYSRQHF